MNSDSVQIFVMNGATTSDKLKKLELKYGEDVQANNEKVDNITNICRICATVTDLVIPIFAGDGLQNNLSDKIHEHLPIKVSEHDVLPRVVCYQCSSTLLAWHELVQCCRQADQALRHSTSTNNLHVDKKTNEVIAERKIHPKSRGCVCRYCDTEYPDDVSLRDHVRTAHVTDIFRYQEGDDPVDEEKSVARATPPATGRAKVREKRDRRIVRNHLGVSSNRRCNTSRSPASEPPAEVDVRRDEIILNDGACEFSEQSSVEDFGPLPESVFEAIEDSQEYREVEHGIDENETHRGDEDVEKLEVNDRRDPPATEEASESRRSTSGTPRGADDKGIKRRKCPKCDKVYTASSSYFYHLKYSHGQTKEHECEVCGKKFGSRASLSAHGSIHTGDRRHACARCGKAFRTAAGLYIHEQTHSGVKTHGCSWCARSFRWRTQLQRHERRHRGERPHACVTCARAFSERADLLRHARTHAAGRHACPRCGDTFAQPRYLRVHVGNKHPDESLVTRNDCK